ncbi:B12-binding domain-containing radical SAM protein [Desulforhabdus amnigena]|jgi:radical SAM superfamily enzyme YgiQ (UPF0313 family)|uniref:B12-binding domain-containing radical SAM protein n=1 Tax=Desulforhabdus amnigena TaxID=40218 RepID=A0A9W6FVQ3_9BACT|nr:B12-binding domain-containing radical SAM protein [Desulforhabdus amnigena]NLJ28638.1 radical SAM protein [Deltaproteobacteria bacterium]GLI35771.1 B12-binding domain-containing radical SAM protein [Desulforhabdus amnigena]
MSKAPFILLVNPWTTDFAAYDLWAKPLGLLLLGGLLKEGGCGVAFIDCLDRYDPLSRTCGEMLRGEERKFGTGKYSRTLIEKPQAYGDIPRRYYRYGIHPESFRKQLQVIQEPDLIWVTSVMTYWYPGVQETIEVLHEVFPKVPVWLGGIYASLCTGHAEKNSGADQVITLPLEKLPGRIEAATGFAVKNIPSWGNFRQAPLPALEFISHPTYAPIMTGRGCPFRCPYCASGILQPRWERRSADAVYEEILHWHETLGVVDFAFYDDALLLQAETSLKPALERLCREGLRLRFHTPNALHVRALTSDWCRLLFESGFTTLRLGLETTRADKQREWGGKVETRMYRESVERLRMAGFSRDQIGVYLLCGLPGQSPEDVAEAIEVVAESGAQPHLCEYSPVPGTAMWSEVCALSRYDIAKEPLFQNNSFFACRRSDFSYDDLLRLKELVRRVRRLP